MKTKEITKFVEKNKKPLLIGVGVVAVLVLCWFLFGKEMWRSYINNKSKKDAEDYTGTNVTPNMNFRGLRDRLVSAFSGPGTDEDEVYSVLSELNTQADWEYLQRYWQNSMNKENIGWGGLIIGGIMGLGTTLIGTMKSELDKKELQRCRTILEEKDIEPGF